MSDPKPVSNVRLYSNNGHWIHISKPGVHKFSVQMLMPLPKADANMTRQLSLPLPPARAASRRAPPG